MRPEKEVSYKKAAEPPQSSDSTRPERGTDHVRAQRGPDQGGDHVRAQRGPERRPRQSSERTREETTSELREDQTRDTPPGLSSELREDQTRATLPVRAQSSERTRETPPVRAQSSERTRPDRHSRSERGKRVSSDPSCGAPERSSGHGSAGGAERSYEDGFLQARLGAPPAAAAAAAAEPPDHSLCRRPAGRILSHPLL